MPLSVQFNHFNRAHWVAVRCEASEATPTVAEASEASGSYLYYVLKGFLREGGWASPMVNAGTGGGGGGRGGGGRRRRGEEEEGEEEEREKGGEGGEGGGGGGEAGHFTPYISCLNHL